MAKCDIFCIASEIAPASPLPKTKEIINRNAAIGLGPFPRQGKDKSTIKNCPNFFFSFVRAWECCCLPDQPFLVMPRVSSERRDYAAIGWIKNRLQFLAMLLKFIESATLSSFFNPNICHAHGLASTVGGKLESRYLYSIGIGL